MKNGDNGIAALGLSKPAVAIGFLSHAPENVAKWEGGAVPAGCSFWRLAMDGRTFYTEPSDHWNCAVGAYTHGIGIPEERGQVLQDTVGFMVSSGYLEMAEVPGIPVLPEAPRYIAYGPAETAPFAADLILLAARPAAAMLLYEAGVRAGAISALAPSLGRPACAILPLAKNQEAGAFSFGCKGNRTFTGLPDEELYFCVPGSKWDALRAQLGNIEAANGRMEAHYLGHRSQFPVIG
jgi:uncharacterized protein (DUF169 family)